MPAISRSLRVDEESAHAARRGEEAALVAAIERHRAEADAVILSDYGKGVLGPSVIAGCDRAARGARGIPVYVDPKSDDFARYRGATCITPNLQELAAAAQHAGRDR